MRQAAERNYHKERQPGLYCRHFAKPKLTSAALKRLLTTKPCQYSAVPLEGLFDSERSQARDHQSFRDDETSSAAPGAAFEFFNRLSNLTSCHLGNHRSSDHSLTARQLATLQSVCISNLSAQMVIHLMYYITASSAYTLHHTNGRHIWHPDVQI